MSLKFAVFIVILTISGFNTGLLLGTACDWWSPFAEKQAALTDCELGRLYAAPKNDTSGKYVENALYIGKMKDIEVCSLICCEKKDCGAAVFVPESQKCYALNCVKDEALCRNLVKNMTKIETFVPDNATAPVYLALVFSASEKPKNKRDTALSSKIIDPLLLSNMQKRDEKNDSHLEKSIMDELLANELRIINETTEKNSAINAEIQRKRSELLAASDQVAKNTQMLNVEKVSASNSKQTLSKAHLVAGLSFGGATLVALLGALIVYWRKTHASRENVFNKQEYAEDINTGDLDNINE